MTNLCNFLQCLSACIGQVILPQPSHWPPINSIKFTDVFLVPGCPTWMKYFRFDLISNYYEPLSPSYVQKYILRGFVPRNKVKLICSLPEHPSNSF